MSSRSLLSLEVLLIWRWLPYVGFQKKKIYVFSQKFEFCEALD